MQAARKLKGRPQQQKMRLTVEIVQACVATLVRDDSEVWELVLALYIVLMFVTFNRWVDMTALRIDGMLNRDGWIGLFVGLSKTDQVLLQRAMAGDRAHGKVHVPGDAAETRAARDGVEVRVLVPAVPPQGRDAHEREGRATVPTEVGPV